MNPFFSSILAACAAFAATNIDEIIVLMLLFAQDVARVRRRHILAGHFIGFTVLVLVSLLGYLGALFVPRPWIGLLGLVPLGLGIKELFEKKESDIEAAEKLRASENKPAPNGWWSAIFSPMTFAVAAIAIGDGGDNIAVYIPLFARSSLLDLGMTLIIFFALTGLWCLFAYALASQSQVADLLERTRHWLVPVVFITLGLYILLDSGTLALVKQGQHPNLEKEYPSCSGTAIF